MQEINEKHRKQDKWICQGYILNIQIKKAAGRVLFKKMSFQFCL